MGVFNCPICGQAGLPDYKTNHVVCPQCDSDLKPFLLLYSVTKPKTSRVNVYVLIGISLLSILFLALFFKSNTSNKELIAKNAILNDSINQIQNIDIKTKAEKVSKPIIVKQEPIVNYVVKKGDYPYKIAKFFYNDGNKYKQIEKDNNLVQPYNLKVGQILIIKIPQE